MRGRKKANQHMRQIRFSKTLKISECRWIGGQKEINPRLFEAWGGIGSGWKGTKCEKMGNISNTDNKNKKCHPTLRYIHLHRKATI